MTSYLRSDLAESGDLAIHICRLQCRRRHASTSSQLTKQPFRAARPSRAGEYYPERLAAAAAATQPSPSLPSPSLFTPHTARRQPPSRPPHPLQHALRRLVGRPRGRPPDARRERQTPRALADASRLATPSRFARQVIITYDTHYTLFMCIALHARPTHSARWRYTYLGPTGERGDLHHAGANGNRNARVRTDMPHADHALAHAAPAFPGAGSCLEGGQRLGSITQPRDATRAVLPGRCLSSAPSAYTDSRSESASGLTTRELCRLP